MPIRPAVYADLVPAAKALCRAFSNEALFAEYLHPHLKQYPDDMYLHFLQILRLAYVGGPDSRLLVSCTKNDQGEEVVAGLAHWSRKRATPHESYYTSAMIKAVSAYNYLESFVYPNRALDPSRSGILAEMGPFVKHHWTGTRAEVWDLTLLGVDPNFGRRGIGKELVKWGFDRAREEGVGCSVIASDGKDRFYQGCGYDVIVGRACDYAPNGHDFRTIPGGTIHFWDNDVEPRGIKTFGEE